MRVVPIESVYKAIRSALRKLDVALLQYERKKDSQVTVDRAYDDFTDAMRKLGLGSQHR